jgi:hypothetical protein
MDKDKQGSTVPLLPQQASGVCWESMAESRQTNSSWQQTAVAGQQEQQQTDRVTACMYVARHDRCTQ